MENNDNLLGVLKTLFKWKKQLFYVCLIAAIGSVIISLLLPVYYQATTVFLAASPDQAKPELLYGSGAIETEFYGNEGDIDRLLTIAESNELIEFLVDSFNLYDHYEIDSTRNRAPYRVRQQLFDLYEVKKTKRDAIELSVEDRDKVFATHMANAAREKIDALGQQLIKESQAKSIRAYEFNIRNKEQLLATLSDSLMQQRRKYGIYNTEAQTESLTEQFARAEAQLTRDQARLEALQQTQGVPRDSLNKLRADVRGMREVVQSMEKKIGQFNEGMGRVDALNRQYMEATRSLGEDMERYKILISTYRSDFQSTILVERAQVPVIKSRPKRMIIVLASVTIAFLFSVIGVLILEAYKDVNWREVFYAK